MLNINDFFMNLEDIWPQISPINKFKTHIPKNQEHGNCLAKISFGSQKNIISVVLVCIIDFYWLTWPSETHCIKSNYTRKVTMNTQHYQEAYHPNSTHDFFRLSSWTSWLICSVFPSIPWPSGFPHQHPHGWPLLLATAVLHSSRWPQAHLSWSCPTSRHMLSAYGLPVLKQWPHM